MGNNGESAKGFEYKKFATPRIIGSIAIAVIVLWALSIIFSSPEGPSSQSADEIGPGAVMASRESQPTGHAGAAQDTHPATTPTTRQSQRTGAESTLATGAHGTTAAAPGTAPAEPLTTHKQPPTAPGQHAATDDHAAADSATPRTSAAQPSLPATAVVAPVHKPTPKGVAFVEAAIKPLQYELAERWWGWRANDIINLTDNVNNYQLGVLEVTRRTAVTLSERLSRTGITAALDENLENATNWFMVTATSYWFPSAESKYRDGLKEWQIYIDKLKAGKAVFYTRVDNLIPLLASYEELLGSCDENLVKKVHEDGSAVSFFSADDYFYYTKGVANSMATVLEAVHHDFLLTLESRHATELLHHAIISCQHAAEIDPWIILDRDLSSTFANHRANMAAPISHARFYLGQLIKTLST